MTARGVSLAVALLAASSSPATALTLSAEDVDAIGRVSIAEAGNQSDAGIAAVIDVILHRAASGGFGGGVQGVLDAPRQFEAVSRAGGSWRSLPGPSPEQRIRIATILSLKADGVLGDVSQGGLYFQNEAIVRKRAASGQVRSSLVGFDGMPVTVRIGEHTFYRSAQPTEAVPVVAVPTLSAAPAPGRSARDDYAAAVQKALGGGELPE